MYTKIEDLLKDPNWKEILNEKKVKVLPRDPYYVLDYIQGAVDWNDPIPRQCRGLFIRQSDLSVASRAYDKFFNMEEPFVFKMSTENTDYISVVEKLDGSLVRAYWSDYSEKWVWGTNGGTNASKVDLKNPFGGVNTFYDAILKAVGLTDIELQAKCLQFFDPRYTYVFELCSEHQTIVVLYPDTSLYYHGRVNNLSGKVMVDNVATQISPLVRTPLVFFEGGYSDRHINLPVWYENNIRPIINRINIGRFFPTCEGTIIRGSYNGYVSGMIKVKQTEYLESHYLGSYDIKKNILDAISKGEEMEFEHVVLNAYPYFKPQYELIVNNIRRKIEELSTEHKKAVSLYNEYRGDRKSFAQQVNATVNPSNRWIYFYLFSGEEIDIKQYVIDNYDKLFN